MSHPDTMWSCGTHSAVASKCKNPHTAGNGRPWHIICIRPGYGNWLRPVLG
jgi:hypothetical protein